MRHHAGMLVVLVAALFGGPATAVERPFGSSAGHTAAVAVFPDVKPGPPPVSRFADVKPAPLPNPALELLATNPYEAELVAKMAAQNLYGDDLKNPYTEEIPLKNPYTDEVSLGNPYTDELRFKNPYSGGVSVPNPYSDASRFKNPYTTP